MQNQTRRTKMIILNSLKLLGELSELEIKINNIKELCHEKGIELDDQEILQSILNQYRRPLS